MCGIAGFVDSEFAPRGDATLAADRALVHRMCGVIRHRGPDDEGARVTDGVGLGMRRLSIIDLDSGRQPMPNEDGSVQVVFNGEIYNYRELRRELTARGHRFATASDTEAIVHAWEEWGEDALLRLRGMFGIAIWDARARVLLLARDRAGIKPLHYAVSNGRLYFGSEIKSLLAAGLARDIDTEALEHFLAFLYTPSDSTIFRGIDKLPPGHLVRWQDGRLTRRAYWQMPASEDPPCGEAEAGERLLETLRDAVRSHMVSDVPLGAFLSGGIDSSLIVALMAEASDRPVRTFSIGFDETGYDELAHARVVARHFATDHHELVVRPDALAILDDVVRHFDEPFGDPSAVPTWYVSEVARRHVTVALSGDGGDELFGGYDRYTAHPRVAAFDRLAPAAARHVAGLIWPRLPHGVRGRNFLRHVSRSPDGRYLDDMSLFRADERDALLGADLRGTRRAPGPEASMARRFDRLQALPPIGRMMHFDFETYLPEDVLTKVDRMSMAHSLESRVPLLDNEVIALAARLPVHWKVPDGRRKHLLKQVAAHVLPPEIVARRKHGFHLPIEVWFRGRLGDAFQDIACGPTARQRGYFDPGFVARIFDEHRTGRRDHAFRLWQLLVFELWHRQYLDHVPDAVAGPVPADMERRAG
jgi:asparagine synthase (glutamine-hydrolysing)